MDCRSICALVGPLACGWVCALAHLAFIYKWVLMFFLRFFVDLGLVWEEWEQEHKYGQGKETGRGRDKARGFTSTIVLAGFSLPFWAS